MERENKKFRADGRKEYTDSIRQLAQFIKRLDERVIKFEKELKLKKQLEKEATEKRRIDDLNKKKEELAKKLEKLESNEDEIIRTKEERGRAFLLDNDYDDIECFSYTMKEPLPGVQLNNDMDNNNNNNDNTSEPIHYECKVCEKDFQTEKQLEQHINSKQHKQKEKEKRTRKSKNKTNNNNTNKSNVMKESDNNIEKLIDSVIINNNDYKNKFDSDSDSDSDTNSNSKSKSKSKSKNNKNINKNIFAFVEDIE